MLRALDETVITGVPTTGPFHKLLLNHHAFRAGTVDTGFIPKYIDELKTPPPTSKVRGAHCWTGFAVGQVVGKQHQNGPSTYRVIPAYTIVPGH
jgi:acetyl/propionyl-CoA carboxylase alpha subunit